MNPLARELEKCSRVKESIGFYSHKTKKVQKCESRKELYACLLREFDHNVESYLTQPQSFGYKIDGKTRRYTPDALVKTCDGAFHYEEVKPASDLEKPHIQEKYSYIQQEVFEKDIKRPFYLVGIDEQGDDFTAKNCEYLYPFLQLQLDEIEAEGVVEHLSTTISVSQLFDHCLAKKRSREFSIQLIANGFCSFPTHEFINPNSILEVNHV